MIQTAKVITMEKPFDIKPYSKKELYERIGVSKYIFNRWIKAIEPRLGKPIAGVFSARQVLLIVETYGVPCQVVNQAA